MKLKLDKLLKRAEAFNKLAEEPELVQEQPQQPPLPPPVVETPTLPPAPAPTPVAEPKSSLEQEFETKFQGLTSAEDLFQNDFLLWVCKNNLVHLLTEEHYKEMDQLVLAEPFWFDVYFAYCTKKLGNKHNLMSLLREIIITKDERQVIDIIGNKNFPFKFDQLAPLIKERFSLKSGYSALELLEILTTFPGYNPKVIEDIIIAGLGVGTLNDREVADAVRWKFNNLDIVRIVEEALKGQPGIDSPAQWIWGFASLYMRFKEKGVRAEPILQKMGELNQYHLMMELAEKADEKEISDFPYGLIGDLLMASPDPLRWMADYIQYYGGHLSEESVRSLQARAQDLADSGILVLMFNKPSITSKMDTDSFIKFLSETDCAFMVPTIAKGIADSPNFNMIAIQKIVEKSGDEQAIAAFLAAAENSKFNFASYKKRYNDVAAKNIKNDPKRVERVSISAERNIESHTPSEDRAEAQLFVQELLSKGDWFSLRPDVLETITGNVYVRFYKKEKNKSFSNLYHEAFKANYNLVPKLRHIGREFAYTYDREIGKLITNDTFEKLARAANNFDQYVKLLSRMLDGTKIMHDEGIDINLIELAVLNTKFDIADATNQEFLSLLDNMPVFNNPSVESKLAEINRLSPTMLNVEEFLQNRSIFLALKDKFYNREQLSFKRNSPEYLAVKQLHSDLAVITEFHTIKEYVEEAKPKDAKLAELNQDMGNGIQFKVLKYLDPRAFRVGIETNCCQRIGGAGEDAAIDSYINPLAGVLILFVHDLLVAQSYFHYVPEQKGVILDNVESSSRNMQLLGLTELHLSKIYADYAAKLKQEMPDLQYVKCGTEYNKINNSLFGKSQMESDPRHFEVDNPYSDFDEDEHLDLLAPREELVKATVPEIQGPKMAKASARGLTTAIIRKFAIERVLSA